MSMFADKIGDEVKGKSAVIKDQMRALTFDLDFHVSPLRAKGLNVCVTFN